MDIRQRSNFRVIAEGDDAVGSELTLADALTLLDVARSRGRRFVAVVDDSTGAIVDERRARLWVKRGPPPLPGDQTAPCPACEDEGGMPTGDVLVQLPSGTWVRDTCDVCRGARRVQREELARRDAQVVDESAEPPPAGSGRRIVSGTRPRVGRVLVIYDGPLFPEALRQALADELEVKVVTDAQQALASMIVGHWFDVVLCKVAMPGMGGGELRNRVRAESPEQAARFVFVDERADVQAVCELVRRLTSPSADDSVDTAVASR
ncbi:MAG TPA: response regulator [Polyangiaceae bacterium]